MPAYQRTYSWHIRNHVYRLCKCSLRHRSSTLHIPYIPFYRRTICCDGVQYKMLSPWRVGRVFEISRFFFEGVTPVRMIIGCESEEYASLPTPSFAPALFRCRPVFAPYLPSLIRPRDSGCGRSNVNGVPTCPLNIKVKFKPRQRPGAGGE